MRSTQRLASAALIACAFASAASAQSYALVNVGEDGMQDAWPMQDSRMSDDGLRIAFETFSPFLVTGDVNGKLDVVLRDRANATTVLVSVSTAGVQADQPCELASISRDGRFVVFSTLATTLDPLDTNGKHDIYVRDVDLGVTELVSLNASGAVSSVDHLGGAVSDDGRFVAFTTTAPDMVAGFNSTSQLICRDRLTGTNEILSLRPDGLPASCCFFVAPRHAFSSDGRYVCFTSGSSNLIAGDTNGERDVFVRDRVLGVTERMNLSHFGVEADDESDASEISPDGRFVVFTSSATNLVAQDPYFGQDLFVRDRLFVTTRIVSIPWHGGAPTGQSFGGQISSDGRYVSFVSLGGLSADGASAVVRDQIAQTTTAIFPGHPGASWLQTSPDMRYSLAIATSNMIPNPFPTSPLAVVDHLGSSAFARYCTSKQNSAGCLPLISCSGLPSASGPDDAFVTSWDQLEGKSGVFFWGHATASIPFAGGTLCVQPPIKRTPVTLSTSLVNTEPCDGTFSFHLTQAYATGEGLQVGDTIHGQWWGRDPGYAPPNNASLTDALSITLLP